MELNYTEFRSLVFYTKNLPCTFSLDTVDGERYYELHAAEVMANYTYTCNINSVDDNEETVDFESYYKHLCNRPIIIPGMTPDVQELMVNYLQGIHDELRLLNKRIDFGVESGIGHEDISGDD